MPQEAVPQQVEGCDQTLEALFRLHKWLKRNGHPGVALLTASCVDQPPREPADEPTLRVLRLPALSKLFPRYFDAHDARVRSFGGGRKSEIPRCDGDTSPLSLDRRVDLEERRPLRDGQVQERAPALVVKAVLVVRLDDGDQQAVSLPCGGGVALRE